MRPDETRPGPALDRTRRHSWRRSRAFRPRGFKPFGDLSNAHPERAGPFTPTSRESAQRLRQLHLQVTAPEQTMIKARALRQTLAPESISKRLSAALLCVPTENETSNPINDASLGSRSVHSDSKDLAQPQMTAHPSRAGPSIPTAVCLADP